MIGVEYQVHQEGTGWGPWVKNGALAGEIGKSKRIEAVRFRLTNKGDLDITLHGRPQLENIGWAKNYAKENEICGTVGEARRLEALVFTVRGKDAHKFSIQYRSHSQDVGTLDWAKDNEIIGTIGGGLRMEALQMMVTDKGVVLSREDVKPYILFEPKKPKVETHDRPKKNGHVYNAVGHGTQTNGVWDPGCTDGNYTEAGLMLPIVKVTNRHLRDWGITVTSDADQNNNRNMTATVAQANAVGADIYVSYHCDYNLAPSGTLPIIYPGSASGMRLANVINDSVTKAMGLTTRAILQRDDFEVTRTNMPACIFELGSIRADINKLLDAEKYGLAIAQGIYNYF